jgi:peptide/nickel transport system permease protein
VNAPLDHSSETTLLTPQGDVVTADASGAAGAFAGRIDTEPGPRRRTGLRVFLRHRYAVAGLGTIIALSAFCFLGPLVYHTDQVSTNVAAANLHPSAAHPLGTDGLGYDQLGRLMVAGQSSIEIGIAAALLATLVGALWGAIAGHFGGFVDSVMMRFVDAGLAIPPLFLVLLLATMVVPTVPVLILVVAVIVWLIPARLVRAECLSLREREYVEVVKGMGGGSLRIIGRHLIPNSIGTIIVNATFNVADAILLITYLSFLGLGPPPPAATWGGMLSDGLNFVYNGYWWLIYPPGLAIVILVLAFCLVGEAARESLETRLQRD